jgi:ubiquitin C-terminal hydrolase
LIPEKNSASTKFIYSLYAIVVHSGSMGGGHYIAYMKHEINGKDRWFYASDSYVKEVDQKDALRAQAYMLFYRRIN